MDRKNEILQLEKTITSLENQIRELTSELMLLKTKFQQIALIPHLLLVEDNFIALRLIETIAKENGCNITSVRDGENALKLATQFCFDLILTDIGLPGISGKELAKLIRDHERKAHRKAIPIIGITAHALTIAKDCLNAGMNKVFAKPISPLMLQNIMNNFLGYQSHINVNKKKKNNDLSKELFNLENYPLFDLVRAKNILGSEKVLNELLVILNTQSIPEDEIQIKEAYAKNDWDSIQSIAHKMKSGAIYCGAMKMQYACQYLESYYKSGKKNLLEKLYCQLLQVLDETKQFIPYSN